MSRPGAQNPNWKGGMVTLQCLQCRRDYKVIPCRQFNSKYCSKPCRIAYEKGERVSAWRGGRAASRKRYKAKTRKGVIKIPRRCKACGETGIKKGKRYHPQCKKPTKHKKQSVSCVVCGKTRSLWIKNGRVPLRCMGCDLKNRDGEANGRWKGGITPINHRIRGSKKYSEWRKSVFERDNYTCVFCGQRGGQLNADHIKPFSQFPELRFELSNGRTLCVPCHKTTDTYLSGALKIKHYSPMLADGALRDHRVKPTGKRVHEEAGV
jgi:5-methylcytosine-specific restriction endonuclease McrA